jgi:uncharacterized protein (TIGR03382 family)
VKITYGGDRMSFPAVMAHHGPPVHRSTLYVAARRRATLGEGWDAQDPTDLSGSDPGAVFDAHLEDLGAERTYLRTWAGTVEAGDFVTRFDTIAPRENLDLDPVLVLEESVDELAVWIDYAEDGSTGSRAAAAFPLLLLGLGWLGRRRR